MRQSLLVGVNYMLVCTHARNKKFFASKSKCIVCLNEIFGWKSFLSIIVSLTDSSDIISWD